MGFITANRLFKQLILKYVGTGGFIDEGEDAEVKDITVLVINIRGYFSLTENLSNKQLSDLINNYYSFVINSVVKNKGSIENIFGDHILCVFGSPFYDEDKSLNAIISSDEIADELNSYNRIMANEHILKLTLGISSGESLIGSFGNKHRSTYTALGLVTNRALKLAKYGQENSISIDKTVYDAILSGAGIGVDNFKIKEVEKFKFFQKFF